MSLKRKFKKELLKFRLWLSRDWSYEGVEMKKEIVEETTFKKKVETKWDRVYKNKKTGGEKRIKTLPFFSYSLWEYKEDVVSMTMEEPIMT